MVRSNELHWVASYELNCLNALRKNDLFDWKMLRKLLISNHKLTYNPKI